MAGVEKIKEKILLDSEAKASSIAADAQKQAAEIIEKAKHRAAVRAEEIQKKAAAEAADKIKISSSMQELEMRKDMLATKQELIETVFKNALTALSSMDSSEYLAILQKLIISAVETGEEEIVLSKGDTGKMPVDFIDRVNESLEKVGKRGSLKLADTSSEIAGGFILRASGVEINYSFEALLRMYRDEIEPEVAAILF